MALGERAANRQARAAGQCRPRRSASTGSLGGKSRWGQLARVSSWVTRHRQLLDHADGGAWSVEGLRPCQRLLYAGRDRPAEVPRDVRIACSGYDHLSEAAQTAEGVRGEDAVDRVKGEPMPVRLDVRCVSRELVFEARGDLVGVTRLR